MSVPSTRQTDLQRYLETNTTAANFVLSAGYKTAAEFGALALPFINMEGFRSLDQFSIFGTGANNATVPWQLVMAYKIADAIPRVINGGLAVLPPLYELKVFASGTAVLSSLVGVDGCVIDDGERIADSMGTVTLTAWGTAMQQMFQSTPVAFNPADDSARAFYGIPDAGSVLGFFLDLKLGTATAANALYRLVT